ncbi:MAG TPA: DNA mismatch repair protein MutS [Polyangiaceae bacterium]
MDARETYERGRSARSAEVAALEAKARTIGTGRLLLAAAALAILGGIVWARLGAGAWAALAATVAAFVALVLVHARVHDAKERAAAALRFHERGLARMAHAWAELPVTSERFGSGDHPFTRDLDVFGRSSVMQLVDGTETRLGEERLAKLLSLEEAGAWPTDVGERQAAARDLAARPAFREALATAGGVLSGERADPAPLLAWAEGKEEELAPALRVLSWLVPAAVVASVVATLAMQWPAGIVTLAVAVAIGVGLATSRRLLPMLEAASTREQAVSRWRAMIEAIEREPFDAPLLLRQRERLSAAGRRASVEIAALERIVSFADARRNEVFALLIGPLLMWHVHCAAALLRWRARARAHVRDWLEALAEVEALASLGGFTHEHPSFVFPELAPEPIVDARGLGHPLIAQDKRVGNDVRLPAAGRALVVTGSNMSGKSTLLRAIGVNVVLANAGAPVCAAAARIGPARVATSMRIDDSLEQGVSHFYAELRRLKRVIDLAQETGRPPVLFLLDEILHGTNSRERVLGACAVVKELLARGALGAVSTHDLGITALEKELGGLVENVHFEEQVRGEEMSFDYVLRPGIVQSSNALRLMRAVGIDVAP